MKVYIHLGVSSSLSNRVSHIVNLLTRLAL